MFSDNTIIAIEILRIIIQFNGKLDTTDVLDRVNRDKKRVGEILSILDKVGIISHIDNKYSTTPLLSHFSLFELMELIDGRAEIRVGSDREIEMQDQSVQMKLSMIDTFAQKILKEIKLKNTLK